jgi:hypothetical protein
MCVLEVPEGYGKDIVPTTWRWSRVWNVNWVAPFLVFHVEELFFNKDIEMS